MAPRGEARGAILRELVKGSRNGALLYGLCGEDRRAQLKEAIKALEDECLIVRNKGGYALPD